MSKCNCGNSRCCVPQRGERGLRGNDGIDGAVGPAGSNGDTGPIGPQGDPGVPAETFPLVTAIGQPTDIPLTPPAINGARLCDAGSIPQPIPESIDEDGSYDPNTGIWTCLVDGVYNFNFWVHISDEAGLGIGRWKAGLMYANGSCNFLCAGEVNIVNDKVKHIDITASNNGQELVVSPNTAYRLRIINVTSKNYTSTLGDIVKMSIIRIR